MEGRLNSRTPGRHFLFRAHEKDRGKRLDLFLTECFPDLSRSQLQKYIQEQSQGGVLVNSLRKKPNYRLRSGDSVELRVPEPRDSTLAPAQMALDILYEDSDILVLNKQPGVPVHPSAGHADDTIVNALIHYLGHTGGLSTIGGEKRPGIVHRLDKDTSGVLLIARNNQAHSNLSRQFAQRKTTKVYEAIVKGRPEPPEGVITGSILRSPRNRKKFTVGKGGKEAITRYRVIDSINDSSWVRLMPETGRTHQIRVHCLSIGHPIVGDPLYSRKSIQVKYIALVARQISFTHPATGELLTFSAPYPEHFLQLGRSLGYAVDEN
jgi:23S rRNA pseudouridine1911/1915/1917 synthase